MATNETPTYITPGVHPKPSHSNSTGPIKPTLLAFHGSGSNATVHTVQLARLSRFIKNDFNIESLEGTLSPIPFSHPFLHLQSISIFPKHIPSSTTHRSAANANAPQHLSPPPPAPASSPSSTAAAPSSDGCPPPKKSLSQTCARGIPHPSYPPKSSP